MIHHCMLFTAMVRALKALQEKIRGLELDRMTAAERFKHLSEETQRNTQLLESGTRATHFSSPPAYPSSPLPSTHGWLYFYMYSII